MRSARSRSAAGFTVIELVLVVAIMGVMAALAMSAFSRYVRKSRTAEAIETLEKAWAGSVSYFHTERVTATGAIIAKRFPGSFTPGLPRCGCRQGGKCSGATAPPATLVAIGAYKMSDFIYQTKYKSFGLDLDASFTAEQIGDLDCDGVLSNFSRSGTVDADGEIVGNNAALVINELE